MLSVLASADSVRTHAAADCGCSHPSQRVADVHPRAEHKIVEWRVLVDADRPGEHLGDGLAGHPHAERLVDPQALVADLVGAQEAAAEGDGQQQGQDDSLAVPSISGRCVDKLPLLSDAGLRWANRSCSV